MIFFLSRMSLCTASSNEGLDGLIVRLGRLGCFPDQPGGFGISVMLKAVSATLYLAHALIQVHDAFVRNDLINSALMASMERTEYERLVDEKQKILEFLEAIDKEMERAHATIKAGSEWEAKARMKLSEIERRLAELRGT